MKHNLNKIKWIYKKYSGRYTNPYIAYCNEEEYYKKLNEEDFYNIHWYQHKKNYNCAKKHYINCKEYEKEYNINLKYKKKDYIYLDRWIYEERVSSWYERNSWKRNSKRNHQWKENINK